MKNIMVCAIIFALAFVFVSCAGQKAFTTEALPEGKDCMSMEDAAPTDAEYKNFIKAVNGFSFGLYKELLKNAGNNNLFYSPYSIASALSMTYSGARGQTEKEMEYVLGLSGKEAAHKANALLIRNLDKISEGLPPCPDCQGHSATPFALHVSNAIWSQKDYKFFPSFLDTLNNYYSASVGQLDFASEPEKSRLVINEWVEQNTNRKIRDLLPPGSIDRMTSLVLTNAVYFNAAWLRPFEKSLTRDAPFILKDGTVKNVPMMTATDHFSYFRGEGFGAVELFYTGADTSMLILVPDSGRFDEFEAALDLDQLGQISNNMYSARIKLVLPLFSFESAFSLADSLAGMGMATAFSDRADFSGMDGSKNLYISNVLHKAFVKVDEEGTEAAAATAVLVSRMSIIMEEALELVIDRPFLFFIREKANNAILFAGRIMDPD